MSDESHDYTDTPLKAILKIDGNDTSELANYYICNWLSRVRETDSSSVYCESASVKSEHLDTLDGIVSDLVEAGFTIDSVMWYNNILGVCEARSPSDVPLLLRLIRYVIDGRHEGQLAIWSPQMDLARSMKEKYGKNENRFIVSWAYITDGVRYNEIDFNADEVEEARDEFYPFVPETKRTRELGLVRSYFSEFMASQSPVLLLLGEPGTGKTTFIRNLIKHEDLRNTVISYDEKLLSHDVFYYDFVSGRSKLMVIEDADTLLSSRSKDLNRTMSKLLNISDGIMRLRKKKIVFSTNLPSASEVDEALIRPGRCFDVLKFRPLVGDEIDAAAAAAGVSSPRGAAIRSCTLSELFNQRPSRISSRKVGFRAGE